MRRGRLAEYAYEYTKRMLFDGTLAPGERLRVEDVVTALQTSRQPVMDAFKRLASEGFLEITPQVGCRVVVPEPNDVADFFLILGAVAGLAADIASERRTADELVLLRRIVDEIEALHAAPLTAETVGQYRQAERAFQQELRAMAHSETFSTFAAELLDRRDFYIACIAEGERRFAEAIRQLKGQHRAIVEAIAQSQPEMARERTEALILRLSRFACGTAASSSLAPA